MPRSAGSEMSESIAEKGKAFVNGVADRIADVVVAFHGTDVHDCFPYPRELTCRRQAFCEHYSRSERMFSLRMRSRSSSETGNSSV